MAFNNPCAPDDDGAMHHRASAVPVSSPDA